LLAAFTFIFIMFFACVSLFKSLKDEDLNAVNEQRLKEKTLNK